MTNTGRYCPSSLDRIVTFREIRKQLERVRIVLVNPQDSRNVGAACRAMKTMGVERLFVVGRPDLNEYEAKTLAVHAGDVFDARVAVDTLAEATDGCALVAGTTRRTGKRRKVARLTPAELAARFASTDSAEMAVVFGSEADGLSDEDLSICSAAVTIPTSPDFPTLNLSHAVQIVCYELFKSIRAQAGKQFYSPIDGRRMNDLVETVIGSLKSIGFFKLMGPEDMRVFLRDIFARARLSGAEADRLAGLFQKIAGIARKNRRTDGADQFGRTVR